MRVSDARRYSVPASLDELRGPASGTFRLPAGAWWGPDAEFDASSCDDVIAAYPEVLCEGSAEDVGSVVNAGLLRDVWRDMVLPRALRPAWESRFPELAV